MNNSRFFLRVREWASGTITAGVLCSAHAVPLEEYAFPEGMSLPALRESAAAWADFNGDGVMDVAVAGLGANGPVLDLLQGAIAPNGLAGCRNVASLIGVTQPVLAWGDYDQDGLVDLLVLGRRNFAPVSELYRNRDGINFERLITFEPAVAEAADWGDYDNDGDLDLVLAGITATATPSLVS